MQSEPRSPLELNAVMRIVSAIAAASVLVGLVLAPYTDRLRMASNAVFCVVLACWAIYGNRTRRNRMLTALLLLIFLAVFASRVHQHDFP
jgi:hypothetical protein